MEQKMAVPPVFERLYDVEMDVTVRFGKTHMPLRDVVRFGVGSMIELNRTVDEPVELLVNNKPFAYGEVVVIDGYYGVRITEIGSEEERSRKLMTAEAPRTVPQIATPPPVQPPAQQAPPGVLNDPLGEVKP